VEILFDQPLRVLDCRFTQRWAILQVKELEHVRVADELLGFYRGQLGAGVLAATNVAP
jgi:hypothetical protein